MNELVEYEERQLAHWESVVARLGVLEDLAPPQAWANLEAYLGIAIRRSLGDAISRLSLSLQSIRSDSRSRPERVVTGIHEFRKQFIRVESVVHFFIDALNTRSSPNMGSLMRTCDWLASESMARALVQLGVNRPPVLTFVDKGLGAAILKAGLRLWDGATDNPAAAIKVTFQNLGTPTALIHESGHMVAALLHWTEELSEVLRKVAPEPAKDVWASWASEIAADAFAFVHTGYASVLSLSNVLDGGDAMVYQLVEDDPHPVPWLRVLLGVAMCHVAFGKGHWDSFSQIWIERYPLERAPASVRTLFEESMPLLDAIATAILQQPMQAFRGKSLSQLIDPSLVSPFALLELERAAGEALYISPYWAREGLRIVALTGLRVGTNPTQAKYYINQQLLWMQRAPKALAA